MHIHGLLKLSCLKANTRSRSSLLRYTHSSVSVSAWAMKARGSERVVSSLLTTFSSSCVHSLNSGLQWMRDTYYCICGSRCCMARRDLLLTGLFQQPHAVCKWMLSFVCLGNFEPCFWLDTLHPYCVLGR